MNLTIDLLALGVDSKTFIEIDTCRITRIIETGVTDLYEIRMGHSKLVFVLGKSPRATFRVLHESDTKGVLEIFGHCTSFSIECSYNDVYKFELFMRVAVQLESEALLYGIIQELVQELDHSPQNLLENRIDPKAA